MQKIAIANLPLHTGKAPRWLFQQMVKLSKAISEIIISEHNQKEFLKRLSNPFFFQAFANVLGWDWHSSGSTPVLCAALKQANLQDLGIIITGGKGKMAIKTPQEIEKFSILHNIPTKRIKKLKYASKIIAKVDNSLIQDNYQLYTHSFFFTTNGKNYIVIQQGLNHFNNYARRYHWTSDIKDFINEPHSAICCNKKQKEVLNLTSKKSKQTRETSLDLIKDNPQHIYKYFQSKKTLTQFSNIKELNTPQNHFIREISLTKKDKEILKKAYELQPKNYEELILLKGMGPKKIRALALISNLIYGSEISWKDPVKYSFSHGGKDNTPYPINKETYNNSIQTLKQAIEQAKIGKKEKLCAIKKLNKYIE